MANAPAHAFAISSLSANDILHPRGIILYKHAQMLWRGKFGNEKTSGDFRGLNYRSASKFLKRNSGFCIF